MNFNCRQQHGYVEHDNRTNPQDSQSFVGCVVMLDLGSASLMTYSEHHVLVTC